MNADEWLRDILQPDKQYYLKETYHLNKIFKMSRFDPAE
jgi:hypothetical protein